MKTTFWHIWKFPVLLGALTLFGLLAALIGAGGGWHILAWITLIIPLGVCARYGVFYRRK
jgi:hypothetical protein